MPQHVRRVQGIPADLGRQLHVLQSGQVLHQVVELEDKADVVPAVGGQLLLAVIGHLLSVHQDGALVALVHAAQNVEHRGLARARGAHDDAELPLFNLKGDIPHGGDDHLAHLVPLDHVFQGNVCHGFHLMYIIKQVLIYQLNYIILDLRLVAMGR